MANETVAISDLAEQTTAADTDYMVIGGADMKKIKWSTIIALIKTKLGIGDASELTTASKELVGGVNELKTVLNGENWKTATLGSAFLPYNAASTVTYRKKAGFVEIRGAIKPSAAIASGGKATIFTLPVGYRPPFEMVKLCQGSGRSIWTLTISTAGVVGFERYGTNAYAEAPTTVWLPLHCVFGVD